MKGIVAGAFDLIHPGYVRLFEECKNHCDHLTVALHVDPTIERPHKTKPVQSIEERTEILLALKNVDSVIHYFNEYQFLDFLRTGHYQVRFLGSDYINKPYTGKDIDIKIVFVDRRHNYSTTELKRKITKTFLMGVL